MAKKVLIIVENLPVPRDFRMWKEACSLRDAGYKVIVLCPRGKGAEEGYEFLRGMGSLRLFETKRHVKRVSVIISASASAKYGPVLDSSSRQNHFTVAVIVALSTLVTMDLS